MGKASKWLMNFLLGKKEDKAKKKNLPFYDDNVITETVSVPSTPTPSSNYKRRWSFGKPSSKGRAQKFSKSLDSLTPLITQHTVSLQWEDQLNNKTKVVAVAEAVKRAVVLRDIAQRITKSVEDAAATRIQAAFRSYLAKKALCALRALVKLQALARGHLVRKQTTVAMRQMQALMAIQARARFQRIQLAEESSQLVERSQSSRHGNFSNDNRQRGANREEIDLNIYEAERVLKHKYDHMVNLPVERRERGITKFYSGELSISKREQKYEFSFSTAHNSPEICSPTHRTIPGRASFTYQKPDYVHPITSPNYMANTESSRAKARSQSEPKQRPKLSMRTKSKQTASMDGRNAQQEAQMQGLFSPSAPIAHENQDPWFIKFYNITKAKKSDGDAKSIASSSHSNYSKLIVTYEPHLNLY